MSKFRKTERQYIKGIVQNLSLQRFTDTDIVEYFRDKKQIDITRAMVNKVKNDAEQEAEGWYIELKESRHKLIAFYKDRLDSLVSYQKRLNDILLNDGRSEIAVRAIAELHRIEMSIFELLTKFPEFQLSNGNGSAKVYGGCTCSTTSLDSRTHSVCRTCQTTWCHSSFSGQDWCPNPDCSSGLAGSSFKPFDEHYNWVECSDCEQWFKKQEILEVHRQNNHQSSSLASYSPTPTGDNMIIRPSNALPNTIIQTSPSSENRTSEPNNILVDTLAQIGTKGIEEPQESDNSAISQNSAQNQSEEESAADRYWSRNKFRPNPRTRIPQP